MSTYPRHRVSNTDNLRGGNAVSPNRNIFGAPVGGKLSGRYESSGMALVQLGAPAAAAANNIGLSQSVGAGANFVLNGALAAGSPAVATLDVPRNVVAAWTTTSILTIRGTDEYGQSIVEVSASGTAHTGNKAFKTITSITSSASITAATVGTGAKLGLPYRPSVGGLLGGILGENTADAGTYVAPERSASTGTTNDVRGTYTTAGAMNGSNVYAVRMAMDNGPADADLFGIAQFATG